MLGLEKRRTTDWILGKCQLVAAGAVVSFGALLKADPSRFGPALSELLKWLQSTAWIVVIVGPIAVAVLQGARRKFGNPWAWEAVQKLLDEFRGELFSDLEKDPLDHHRVTLFKYYRTAVAWSDPRSWKHWLVAVARSDHLTKLKIRRFRAPDDGEKCEGVVGHAWRCKGWVIVPSQGTPLPALSKDSPQAELDQYAKETCVDTTWVRCQLDRGRPLAASYAALVVLLKGRPWGVLVIDSRKPGTIDPEKLKRFVAYGKLLTPLLERI
ncbi:MAG: hypothetical protein KF768_07810 [Phycisphaeraceae bacterium]|nr:hypothetical protein [Phycisphaeraceae bacterium]